MSSISNTWIVMTKDVQHIIHKDNNTQLTSCPNLVKISGLDSNGNHGVSTFTLSRSSLLIWARRSVLLQLLLLLIISQTIIPNKNSSRLPRMVWCSTSTLSAVVCAVCILLPIATLYVKNELSTIFLEPLNHNHTKPYRLCNHSSHILVSY